MDEFLRMLSMWLIATIPWIIVFGIPIIKIFLPILKEHDLLFGQQGMDKPCTCNHVDNNQRKHIKNIPIFLKIFFSLLIVGVFPVSTLGIYEIISKADNMMGFNINAIF